tara:strand:+ start:108638 stop:109453 length:816 start_codon:yes stop_codon:yes gene_type:complete
MATQKSKNVHTRWVTVTVAILMLTFLLWVTGNIDVLISEDTLGIVFSVFIIYTLTQAARIQYKNVKREQLNNDANKKILSRLNNSSNYAKTLGEFISNERICAMKDASIKILFARLLRYIQRNPSQPLSQGNMETCEALIEEDFNYRVAEELAQAENLTKYGMLGTFMGLVWGFASVNWGALTADTALSIVGGVVGGVQVALVTSIIGLVSSIILLNQHKNLRASHTHNFMKIIDSIQEMGRVLCYENTYATLAKEMGWVKTKDEVTRHET